mmetsp:Transcript_17502/g.44779  ORF Transcript_17502/g.44779 Transcript_17502/m.44779 type:complete len:256 (+) Transcript_17502:1219-1986(+)
MRREPSCMPTLGRPACRWHCTQASWRGALPRKTQAGGTARWSPSTRAPPRGVSTPAHPLALAGTPVAAGRPLPAYRHSPSRALAASRCYPWTQPFRRFISRAARACATSPASTLLAPHPRRSGDIARWQSAPTICMRAASTWPGLRCKGPRGTTCPCLPETSASSTQYSGVGPRAWEGGAVPPHVYIQLTRAAAVRLGDLIIQAYVLVPVQQLSVPVSAIFFIEATGVAGPDMWDTPPRPRWTPLPLHYSLIAFM